MNLYGFVANGGVNAWDILGMVEVDYELLDLKKIAPEWATAAANPFQGPFRGDAGQAITVRLLRCICLDKKIKCIVIVKSRIFLNPRVQPLVHGGDKPESWERVYGHEQLHVKAVIKAAEKIVSELEAAPDDPATAERARELTADYLKSLREAVAEAMKHDEDEKGDKSDPRPKGGQGYDPQPGTPPLPPKP